MVTRGVAVLIPREFAVRTTRFPETVCLYRVCGYMRCGYIPVCRYNMSLLLYPLLTVHGCYLNLCSMAATKSLLKPHEHVLDTAS